jgi:glycosyltransferase involved in cell wall biosynthesis
VALEKTIPSLVSVFGVKPFRIGGTETFARELSRQLQQHGWQSVLCFLIEPPRDVRRFLDLPNVSLEVLSGSTNTNWGAIKSLAGIIRKYKPRILHLHFIGFLGAFPWLARMLSVEKIFFTDHTSRPAGYSPRRARIWKRAAARMINRPITKVVSVSRFGEDCLATLDLLPRERYALVYNAVDLSRVTNKPERAAQFRKRYAIPENRIVIVQVSWMIPEKGIAELLNVAKLLVTENETVHFVLVGEGEYREQFMKTAVTMGLSEHITWTGLIQDPFDEGVYDVADIVCQLSEWEELFGWMIAEAMAYGKPVVATRVGGIPELVQDGITGFLVERGDTTAASAALSQLASDTDLRKKMGDAGTLLVKEKFDLKRNVSQLLQLYGVTN